MSHLKTFFLRNFSGVLMIYFPHFRHSDMFNLIYVKAPFKFFFQLLILRKKKEFRKYRSSRPEVFCKKGIYKKFTKFSGKHQYRSLFFNKVADWRILPRNFPVNFVKLLRTSNYSNICERLLLKLDPNIIVNLRIKNKWCKFPHNPTR